MKMTHLNSIWEMLLVVRFKTFNMQFEELHQKQSQWTVPDVELRESLRLEVAEVLLPAYRSFVRRFGYDSLVTFLFRPTRHIYLRSYGYGHWCGDTSPQRRAYHVSTVMELL